MRTKRAACCLLTIACALPWIALASCVGLIENPAEGPSTAGTGPVNFRLLTRAEYSFAIADLGLHPNIGEISNEFPAEGRLAGFFGMPTHYASRDHVWAYHNAAHSVSERAVEGVDQLLAPVEECREQNDTCGFAFIRHFLFRAFRRPPSDASVTAFFELYHRGAASDSFKEGIRMVIEAALQSPRFLYRIDSLGTPDDFDMASRLSFLLWRSIPDQQLLDAAQTEKLHTREQLEQQARRMIEEGPVERTIQDFHDQWLDLDKLLHRSAVQAEHPGFGSTHFAMLQTSVRLYVQTLFDQEGSFDDLMTSTSFYSTPELASFYGISGLEAEPGQHVKVDLDPAQRMGILSQPGITAMLSGSEGGSPTLRGKIVREKFLCETLPPPPPDLMFDPPVKSPDQSRRQAHEAHFNNAACVGCHQYMDFVGFGFENYGPIGEWHDSETVAGQKQPIDASGELRQHRAVLEQNVLGDFVGIAGADGLSVRLSRARAARECYVRQWFRFLMGRVETLEDEKTIERVSSHFEYTGALLKELLIAFVVDAAFSNKAFSLAEEP